MDADLGRCLGRWMATTVIAALALAIATARLCADFLGWMRRRAADFTIVDATGLVRGGLLWSISFTLDVLGGTSTTRITSAQLDFFEDDTDTASISLDINLSAGKQIVVEPKASREIRVSFDRPSDAGNGRTRLAGSLILKSRGRTHIVPFLLRRDVNADWELDRRDRFLLTRADTRLMRTARAEGKRFDEPITPSALRTILSRGRKRFTE